MMRYYVAIKNNKYDGCVVTLKLVKEVGHILYTLWSKWKPHAYINTDWNGFHSSKIDAQSGMRIGGDFFH